MVSSALDLHDHLVSSMSLYSKTSCMMPHIPKLTRCVFFYDSKLDSIAYISPRFLIPIAQQHMAS